MAESNGRGCKAALAIRRLVDVAWRGFGIYPQLKLFVPRLRTLMGRINIIFDKMYSELFVLDR